MAKSLRFLYEWALKSSDKLHFAPLHAVLLFFLIEEFDEKELLAGFIGFVFLLEFVHLVNKVSNRGVHRS